MYLTREDLMCIYIPPLYIYLKKNYHKPNSNHDNDNTIETGVINYKIITPAIYNLINI